VWGKSGVKEDCLLGHRVDMVANGSRGWQDDPGGGGGSGVTSRVHDHPAIVENKLF
jgi:hypothetical protein